jgi:hypothetical protein
MKGTWFRRYWYWIVTGILIVAAGMLISAFREGNFSVFILNFFDDWSIALSAAAALILAIAAFRSIKESRRTREQDRELDSWRRRLDEVQRWINEVVVVKSECSRGTGSNEEWRQRGVKARIVIAINEHIKIEAERIDNKFVSETKLVNNINRLSSLLEKHEVTQLSAPDYQQEIEELCTKSLAKISDVKARLKL